MSYELIKQYNNQHTHIKFNGPFQGKTVTWDTHFFTLNGYQKQKKSKNLNSKQFIYIEPDKMDTLKLTVVLKIPKISEPNIKKMIMMIKQYKHLSIGRHEYG